jgi:putative tryptophan/tyrosine transport system substrate-binding protein
MMHLRRREFIALLAGAAAWPDAAYAQQALPVIGFLSAGSPEQTSGLVAAFRNGLGETGLVEGRNVTIDYRWANNEPGRLPELAAALVHRRVSVIATPGNLAAAFAAKAATSTIPIVFSSSTDPVERGLVASLSRPGGNVTGISSMNSELETKRLGLLHELLPEARNFAVLVHPDNRAASFVGELQAAASGIGVAVHVFTAATDGEIDAAFAGMAQPRIEGLLIHPEQLFANRQGQILMLARRNALAAIYPARQWAEAGGLMSYGSSFADQFRQAGIYTGRVLHGEKPAALPILRATKFEFIINMQAARALGIQIPPTLLAHADEVIEEDLPSGVLLR